MVAETPVVETASTEQPVVEQNISTLLQQAAFEPEKIVEKQVETPIVETTTTPVVENKSAQHLEWLKTEFGVDSVDTIKQEREDLKKLKETQPEKIEFKDETSKQLYELLREGGEKKKEAIRIIKEQEQIEELASLVVDKDNAADIIKLQLQLKNKQLSKSEVDFEYNQNYVAPKEPVQKTTEDDEDFQERHNEWKEKVQMVEQRRIIAAKLAQPELNKLKSELSLPEIKPNEAVAPVLSEEELQRRTNEAAAFLQTVDGVFNDFKGFSTQVTNKDVDFPVSYELSQEEKTGITTSLKNFAESNFDANSLFASRWVIKGQDGVPKVNTEQMIKDISAMYSMDNVTKKIASDAANLRMEEYMKTKKNTQLEDTGNRDIPIVLNNQQNISSQLQEAAFGKLN